MLILVNPYSPNSDENEISLHVFTTSDENTGSDQQGHWYLVKFSLLVP